MKKTTSEIVAPKSARNIKRIWIIGIVISIGLGILYVYYFSQNRAADIVAPFGKELISNGAIEECGSGDPGHGPDNNAAYYGAYYNLHMSKDSAISLMNRIAKNNGYTLTHASPSNRGQLGAVADIYIDQWYFDDTSKQNPYIDIQNGPIKLAVIVNVPGSKNGCTPTKTIETGYVELGIEIQLPEFKHL